MSDETLCATCGHTKGHHWDRYGCVVEGGDAWVTGNQPEQPTVLVARPPCCCTDFVAEENS